MFEYVVKEIEKYGNREARWIRKKAEDLFNKAKDKLDSEGFEYYFARDYMPGKSLD